MKRKLLLAVALCSSVAAMQMAVASPAVSSIVIHCPNTTVAPIPYQIHNLGTSLVGLGQEIAGAAKKLPTFRGVPTAGVPLDITKGRYIHDGVQYDASKGRVTCLFHSNNGSDDFDVSYSGVELLRGVVSKVNDQSITIGFNR